MHKFEKITWSNEQALLHLLLDGRIIYTEASDNALKLFFESNSNFSPFKGRDKDGHEFELDLNHTNIKQRRHGYTKVEVRWYEVIPEQGTLCRVSNGDKTAIALVLEYNTELFDADRRPFKGECDYFDTATPLTVDSVRDLIWENQ